MNESKAIIDDPFLTRAIENDLGPIEDLPEKAKSKIWAVYRAFYNAYHEIAKLKGSKKHDTDLFESGLDNEILEYMKHFFSDYQTIYRQFKQMRRNAKELLSVDRQVYPARYRELIDSLYTGRDPSQNQKVLEVIGQVGIGTTIFEPSEQLDVRGSVSVADTITASTINATTVVVTGTGNTFSDLTVTGIATFGGNIDANAGLDVDGLTDLDELNVAGVATFASDLDINAGVDISGFAAFNGSVDIGQNFVRDRPGPDTSGCTPRHPHGRAPE